MDAPSRTALGVALLRALHRIVDDEPWVIDDPVSTALFGEAARQRLERDRAWAGDPARVALRAHVLVRSAFAEERLRGAVARGVAQVVILGAGYDTFAYRQPAGMDAVRVFEVDAPPSQERKRALLANARRSIPANVTFAPIDFERSSLHEGLAASGFDRTQPAFFSWLGVMMYLSRDAARSVLRYVASLPPPTEIAFTFSTPDASADVARRVAELGEPIRTKVTSDELAAIARDAGFSGVTVVSQEEASRYLGTRRDALRQPPREFMACARV